MFILFVTLLWSCHQHDTAFAQKWINPKNRVIFVLEGKPENLSWHMDYQGRDLFNARWTAYNDVKKTEVVLASVLRGTRRSVFHPNITTLKYMYFNNTNFGGNIAVTKFNPSNFHRIGCEVTFRDVETEFQDFVTIQYAGFTPIFSQPLPSTRTYLEGEELHTTVVLRGNPAPILIWIHNGEEITTSPRLRLTNRERTDDKNNDTIITSVLHITNLLEKDTGQIRVIGKYGEKDTRSPTSHSEMILDVQYPPRDISFTSNVTDSHMLQNDQYVRLRCNAKGNPRPVYKIQKAIDVVYEGKAMEMVYLVSGIHEGRHAWFTCIAYNSLGMITKELTLPLQLNEGEIVARSGFARADSSWLKYFIIGAVCLLLIFIIVSLISFAIRRRMRSMNITDEASIAKPSLSQRPSLKYSNGVPSTQSDYPSSVVTSTHEDYATVARDLINRQSTTSKNPKKNITPSTSTKYFGFTNEGMQKSQEFTDIAGPSTKF